MSHQPDPSTPDADSIRERIKAGVQSHRIKLRVLTSAAFGFGFLALVAGFVIVWCYPIFILPKQKEMALHAETLMDQYRTNSIAAVSDNNVGKEIGKLLAVEIQVTNITTAGTAVVALAVGCLALGTLILLTVVVLNRRVAFNQINSNLVQISNQLRELQKARGSS